MSGSICYVRSAGLSSVRWRMCPPASTTAAPVDSRPAFLLDYANADAEQLVDLIVNADPEEFAVFFKGVASHREVAIPLLRNRVAGTHPKLPIRRGSDPSEKEADTLARHQATAAVALLRLGLPEAVWPLLAFSPDPRVQTETIHALVHLGAAPDQLAERFVIEQDVSVRAALLLALADCALQALDKPWIEHNLPRVLDTYRNDPDPGSPRRRTAALAACWEVSRRAADRRWGWKARASAANVAGTSREVTRWS